MEKYVALLRGVNVGGRHALRMETLRGLFESHGYTGVKTLIQSGNVLFSSATIPEARDLERTLEVSCGFAVPVVLRRAKELSKIIGDNPFAALDHTKLHVGFVAEALADEVAATCDAAQFLPERFAFLGSNIYLYLPSGVARTKLPGYLDRHLKISMTIRNWNTVNALVQASTA